MRERRRRAAGRHRIPRPGGTFGLCSSRARAERGGPVGLAERPGHRASRFPEHASLFREMGEVPTAEGGAPLRRAAQRGGIADRRAGLAFRWSAGSLSTFGDQSLPRVEVADHLSDELRGDKDVHGHDRLQEDRARLAACGVERHRAVRSKRDGRGRGPMVLRAHQPATPNVRMAGDRYTTPEPTQRSPRAPRGTATSPPGSSDPRASAEEKAVSFAPLGKRLSPSIDGGCVFPCRRRRGRHSRGRVTSALETGSPGEETCGLPTRASTLNSRNILVTRTSRWSSPMPENDQLTGFLVLLQGKGRIFQRKDSLEPLSASCAWTVCARLDGNRDHRLRAAKSFPGGWEGLHAQGVALFGTPSARS